MLKSNSLLHKTVERGASSELVFRPSTRNAVQGSLNLLAVEFIAEETAALISKNI